MQASSVGDLLTQPPGGGQEGVWEELVRRFGPGLESRVRRILRRCGVPVTREGVEELVQEVYCRLLQGRRNGAAGVRPLGDGAVTVYLGRVAECVVLDWLRRERAGKRGGTLQREMGPEVRCSVSRLIDPEASPEERALARDGYRRLLARCRAVESGEQGRLNVAILVLAALGGWTSREIAGALPGELTPSTVESRLYRLRKRLRAQGNLVGKTCRASS